MSQGLTVVQAPSRRIGEEERGTWTEIAEISPMPYLRGLAETMGGFPYGKKKFQPTVMQTA